MKRFMVLFLFGAIAVISVLIGIMPLRAQSPTPAPQKHKKTTQQQIPTPSPTPSPRPTEQDYSWGSFVGIAIGVIVGFVLYFIPAIVAGVRHHHNGAAIAITNLLLGWTVIGWIAALIWACTNPPVPAAGAK